MSLFKLEEKINSQIYRMFNVLSDGVFLTRQDVWKKVKKNKAFYGIHAGQRCFIAATGPSFGNLSKAQLEALQCEVVFGVNSFYKAPLAEGIVPSYYVLMDNNYWGLSSDTYKQVFKKYIGDPPVFVTDYRALRFLPEGAKAIPLYAKNYPVRRMRDRLDRNASITMNVVGFAILTAIYMGFKEIYLLGSDYNLFCQQKGNHCYDDRDEFSQAPKYSLAFYLKDYHLATKFHYLLAKLAKEKNIRIVNLSEGSLLDAYPIANASEVFGN